MGALQSSSAMACGWPPGLCSSEQRGAQVRYAHLCCQPRCSFPGFHGVAALPGGAGSCVNPQQASTSTEQGVSA
ncbi:hypothetical protein [Pectobacterium brasiliense]|uniref:hypothetical protein n=1 Tax=Pectobacterium brasiliense TaxID=180957 RepID=UPI0025A0A484|nr:hypothetical protein [Pectobacterium brasiliense]WJM80011.1 hypothetical protein QTI90_17180 [Pectobacterium brasiliense]WJM80019.1 hypothetical protein QTI90_17220 [Pectobacterium brasiliense]